MGPFLSGRLGLPVWTENGANTGALCDRKLGVGAKVRNFVYLSLKCGLIVAGELLRGGVGNAGELSGDVSDAESVDRPAGSTCPGQGLRHGPRRRAPDLCVSEIGGETAAIGAAPSLKEVYS